MEAFSRLPLFLSRSTSVRKGIGRSSLLKRPFRASVSLDRLNESRIFCPARLGRTFSSSVRDEEDDKVDTTLVEDESLGKIGGEDDFPYHHRIWTPGNISEIWNQRFIDREDEEALLRKIEEEELAGGRMKSRQLGVLNEDAATDMELLTQNYSAKSLASAVSCSLCLCLCWREYGCISSILSL